MNTAADCKVSIALWDLVFMQDAKASSFVQTVTNLYERDNVDLKNIVSWTLVGCETTAWPTASTSMLSTDVRESSDLHRQIQEALVTSYNMFNKSSQRRRTSEVGS